MRSGNRTMALQVPALLVLAVLMLPLQAQENHDARDIVKTLDELYRSQSSKALVEMKIVTPHWQRTLTMRVWTQGMEKTFIRILSPPREQGVATLRAGDEMWNYLPKTNKVIKVPPSMMMSSWMGSDFNNNDLVQEFTFLDDYTFTLIRPDSAQPGRLYVRAVPKEGRPIVWGNVVLTVRESDYLPVQEAYFDEQGELVRVLTFRDIQVFDGRKMPSVMELIPMDEKGNRTQLHYREMDFNTGVPDDVFTLRHLRSR